MKAICVAFLICVLINANSAFQCYNCTSFNQQSSCGETDPLTSYLSTTRCSTSCYKWILYSYASEVRRGCKVLGSRPPGSSYSEYLCDNNLCNQASSLPMSMKTLITMLTTSLLCLYITRR